MYSGLPNRKLKALQAVPDHGSATFTSLSPFADLYASESLVIKTSFEEAGDGLACLRSRTELVDKLTVELYRSLLSSDLKGPPNFCLAAVGGYGRRELFPCSDIDLLFLARDPQGLKLRRDSTAAITRSLWDLRMRVGHSARTLADCGQLHPDNLEFNISLLDARYLAGDEQLFEKLRSQIIPHLVRRDQQDLIRNLIDLTQQRHAKHGKTIFHLEPNMKEAPGGLRDFQVARWLSVIHEMAERGAWSAPESLWTDELQRAVQSSVRFLSAVRCLLHFSHGRDDNQLTYELQEEAAARGLGIDHGKAMDAAEWMRQYYLHVRSIYRLVNGQIEETTPSRSSLYKAFQDWRSRLSNADFSVIRGKIFPRSPAPSNLTTVLNLFEMISRHSLELSREAERWVEETSRALQLEGYRPAEIWPAFHRILSLPHAASALRQMHRLGFLTVLYPEFRAIDALVIRDFFHRYTVDEHSFTAIQNVWELRAAEKGAAASSPETPDPWKEKFAELFREIERPDLLCFALLLHDVGKGMDVAEHIEGSLQAAQAVCGRLNLAPEESGMVLFLIASHLEMSSTMTRRDIFDPDVVRAFVEKIGTPERLKMLCLFTYADITAVNPEALTPWKAEMLWQLYAMASNALAHSVDQNRLQISRPLTSQADLIIPLVEPEASASELESFLNGFPKRYLAAYAPEEIARHFQWARQLSQMPVQVRISRKGHSSELVVLTRDRPFLFASITGALAGWGMNILKAEAFANSSGVVVDVFRFHDLFRTLELNPSEAARLESDLAAVLTGKVSVSTLMARRKTAPELLQGKIKTATRIDFDDASSSRCSLMEIIAQDRPGLLYQISSALAEFGCNIEVALIDTEAQRAIDVFYLTSQGLKLNPQQQEVLRSTLLERLAAF